MEAIDRISVEPSRRCSKACSFCYNGSDAAGDGAWTVGDLRAFLLDCAAAGVRAVSIGGGEPLEWEGLFELLGALQGRLFRSLTTNGLPLELPGVFDELVRAGPDKVHLSIHSPENPREVERTILWAARIHDAGIRSGINLLVRRSRLEASARALARMRQAGLDADRIVLLPMRGAGGDDTPLPIEVAAVARGPFQSMSCLRGCAKSPRFVSVAADRTVAWCSYTVTRAPLAEPTHGAMLRALDGLGLVPCSEALVRLGKKSPANAGAGSGRAE